MSLKYLVDGVEQVDSNVLIKGDLAALTESADGSYSTAEVEIKDPTGALSYTQLQVFAVEETTATPPRLFTGRIFNLRVNRGPFLTAAKRIYTFSVVDLNGLLHWQILKGADAKRPRETIDARIAWLLANAAVDGLVFDNGQVASRGGAMVDEADYRGQYPDDVLLDIATGWLFFVYWDHAAGEASLFFNTASATIFDSTISLTNVPSEVSSTVWSVHPDPDWEAAGEEIYCGVNFTYKGTSIYRHRQETHDEFFPGSPNHRDGTISTTRIGKLATAEVYAAQWLLDHSGQRVTGVVRTKVAAADVNLIRAGMRIPSAHMRHWPGFHPGIPVRVTQRSVALSGSGDQQTNAYYDLTLHLRTQGITGPGGGGGDFPLPPGEEHWWSGSGSVEGDTGFLSIGGGSPLFVPGTYNFSVHVKHNLTYAASWRIFNESLSQGWLQNVGDGGATSNMDDGTWTGTFTIPDDGDPVTTTGTAQATGSGHDFAAAAGGFISGYRFQVGTAASHHAAGRFAAFDFSIDLVGDPDTEPQPPRPGQWVNAETPSPSPDGDTTVFATRWPYADGSLRVWVDNTEQTAAVTETDPETGEFELAFAPRDDEHLLVWYQGR